MSIKRRLSTLEKKLSDLRAGRLHNDTMKQWSEMVAFSFEDLSAIARKEWGAVQSPRKEMLDETHRARWENAAPAILFAAKMGDETFDDQSENLETP